MSKQSVLALLLLLGLFSLSLLSVAQPIIPTQTPKVVYDSGRTVDAVPYFSRQRLSSETQKKSSTVPPAPKRPAYSLDLADHLPLTSKLLRPGELTVHPIKGLYTPFFVIGMDRQSLGWFNEALDTLVQMRARGIVVEASDRDAWRSLQAEAAARGIRLSLLNGDSLASVYAFTTYPAVFVREGFEQ